MKNVYGQTALSIAKEEGFKDIVALLKKYDDAGDGSNEAEMLPNSHDEMEID